MEIWDIYYSVIVSFYHVNMVANEAVDTLAKQKIDTKLVIIYVKSLIIL